MDVRRARCTDAVDARGRGSEILHGTEFDQLLTSQDLQREW